ncbi:UDP-glycosyltransferase-03 [Ephemera danica]|nr:UDP-glycosyltransferase-03 [Ephemera danica]
MVSYLVLTPLLLLLQVVTAFRVLVLHPLHSGSHEVQLRELSLALARSNNQISYIKFKNFVQLPPPDHPNITFTSLAVDNSDGHIPFVTKEKRGRFILPLDIMWEQGLNPFGVPLDAFRTITPMCDTLLGDLELRKRLQNEKFDVALVDLFTNECGLALAYHLRVPVVAYWALPLSGGEAVFSAGVSQPPGLAPAFMTQLSDRMSFLQRAKNLFFCLMNALVMQVQFAITDRVIQRHLPGTPSSVDLLAGISGLLENSDFALDYSREMPPNIINVGCMQCRPPRPLPQELEEFMQGAGKAGVVLFSMGATFDAAVAPPKLLRRLLLAFSRLPQRVLMKIGGPTPLPPGLVIPSNVRAERWLPQQDLLGHPQMRAFFTHCGLHGALEGAWHGVPAVALPVFGDQGDVAEMLRLRGVAVRLNKDASTEQIHAALRTVIDDPRYRRNSQRLQAVLQDQQVPPMERAVWFVEHVARRGGADHLKLTPITLVQKLCLDVWLAVIVLLVVLIRYRRMPVKLFREVTSRVHVPLHMKSH